MKRTFFGILFFGILFTACRKDDITVVETGFPPEVGISYIFDVYGLVESNFGEPVVDALVTVDDVSTYTNEQGLFYIKATKANASGVFLEVDAEGYFEGGRRLYPVENSALFSPVKLIQYESPVSFNAAEGTTIEASTYTLNFDPNSIAKDGVSYDGIVELYIHHLKADDPNLMTQMPGDLMASDIDNNLVQLQSFGMLAVEIQSPEGDELEVSSGKQVELKQIIPSSVLNDAPAMVPLWYFDTELGFWKEEGHAILEDNYYIGSVTHFTWWNCDVPNPTVQLCLNLVSETTLTPLPFLNFTLTNVAGFGMISGTTDANGQACGWITEGVPFLLQVYDDCGDLIHSEQYGPFTEALTTITAEIGVSDDYTADISGFIVSCEGVPIEGALVYVAYHDAYKTDISDSNGYYSVSIASCTAPDSIEITAYDMVNGEAGSEKISVPSGSTVEENIVLCNDFEEIMQISSNTGEQAILTICEARVMSDETLILATDISGNNEVGLGFTGFAAGSFQGNYLGDWGLSNRDGINFTIEVFDDVNGFITGSFEGALEQQSDSISGSFIAKRIQ